MTFDPGDWKCHVCGDSRPDRVIAVFRRQHGRGNCECHPAGFGFVENIRYCSDRSACAGAAPTTSLLASPRSVPDPRDPMVRRHLVAGVLLLTAAVAVAVVIGVLGGR